MAARASMMAAPRGVGLRWAFATVVVKLGLAIWLIVLFNEQSPATHFRFYNDSGDVADYMRPVENMIRSGRYTTDSAEPLGSVHRMPGYALTLLPLRAAFDEMTAKGLLVVLQLLIECVAVLLVGDLAFRLTGSRPAGIVSQVLYAASTFVTVFSCTIVPDGLAAHVLLVLTWMFVRNAGGGGGGLLVAAGAAFIYAVFLRPFLAPLAALFSATLLLANRRASPRTRWTRLAAFLIVPVVAEGAWVVRNYAQLGEVIPFHTAGMRLPPTEDSLRRWLISFGGDQVWWRPGSAMAWFEPRSPFFDPGWNLPEAPLTESCPQARVVEGRVHYFAYRQATGVEKENHAFLARQIFDSCRVAYEAEKPFDHHVAARARLLGRFLVHAGPPLPLPRFAALDPGSPRWWLKVTSMGVYAATVILGLIGLGFLLAARKRDGLLVAAITGFLLLLFPLALRFIENRFLVGAYPFLAISAGVAFEGIRRSARRVLEGEGVS